MCNEKLIFQASYEYIGPRSSIDQQSLLRFNSNLLTSVPKAYGPRPRCHFRFNSQIHFWSSSDADADEALHKPTPAGKPSACAIPQDVSPL
jgi:hypothetical protein